MIIASTMPIGFMFFGGDVGGNKGSKGNKGGNKGGKGSKGYCDEKV